MSVQDIILIPMVIGMVMIPCYVGYTILDEFSNAPSLAGYSQQTAHFDAGIDAMRVFDYMIIFLVGGIGMGAIILGAYLRTHPAFSIIGIMMLAMVVMLSAFLANIWYEFQQAPDFATAANDLDNIVRLNDNLPLITAVFGILILIAIYAKPWETTQPSF